MLRINQPDPYNQYYHMTAFEEEVSQLQVDNEELVSRVIAIEESLSTAYRW
jgi:hypothetical protein